MVVQFCCLFNLHANLEFCSFWWLYGWFNIFLPRWNREKWIGFDSFKLSRFNFCPFDFNKFIDRFMQEKMFSVNCKNDIRTFFSLEKKKQKKLTVDSNKVIEHIAFRVRWNIRQVKVDFGRRSKPFFHLDTIIDFKKGSNTPH